MEMDAKPPMIRARLFSMMFIEFFLWASWYVPLGGYANSTLKLGEGQIGLLYATTAIAAIVSPLFIGYVADRLFATERILAVLHLVGAVTLFLSAWCTSFGWLMFFLMINALCFMPTLALVNSVGFRNIDDREKFSHIAVGGTIGWIASGWVVGFLLEGTTNQIFYLAGAGGVAMAIYSILALPHTPPKGAESGGDVLGLSALKLLKEPSFLIFILCAFLISIPLSMYFVWGNAFLVERDYPSPTALQTLCQFSEIVVMIIMPFFIKRIGLKNVLVVGMAAWLVRYLSFSTLSLPLIILGLLVHGFCYCFVFVASFIYADKKAPPGMSASLQSFIAFVIWGLGMFFGTLISGSIANQYPYEKIAAVKKVGTETILLDGKEKDKAPLPDWLTASKLRGSEGIDQLALSIFKPLPEGVGYAAEVKFDKAKLAFLDTFPETGLILEKVEGEGEKKKVAETVTYSKKDLLEAFKNADEAGDNNGFLSYAEWREAQSHVWPPIWLWPAALSAIVCLIFFFGGKDPTPAQEEDKTAQENSAGAAGPGGESAETESSPEKEGDPGSEAPGGAGGESPGESENKAEGGG